MRIFIYGVLFLFGIGIGLVVKGEIQEAGQIQTTELQPIEYIPKISNGFGQQGGGSCGG